VNALTRSKLFSAALENLMQERGVNQVELSRRTGIAVSRVNNYLRGKYRTIKPPHVGAIVEALGGAKASGVLAEAYLFDLLPESCCGLVEVKYPGMPTSGKWAPPSKGLSRDFAEQLQDLYRLCVSSVKVRQRTKSWIEILREVNG
jgi:transcriptional regulator with XRE-family HTH domain